MRHAHLRKRVMHVGLCKHRQQRLRLAHDPAQATIQERQPLPGASIAIAFS